MVITTTRMEIVVAPSMDVVRRGVVIGSIGKCESWIKRILGGSELE